MSIRIKYSKLSKKVFAGKVNKTGLSFIGEKSDITEDFLDCCIDYFELETINTINRDGEPVLMLTADKPNLTNKDRLRKIMIEIKAIMANKKDYLNEEITNALINLQSIYKINPTKEPGHV